ncbi:hypothetical protein EJ05DRAFT_211776 [Pseudovirgaria hyperparasitica]|uniref:Uncharacterized protein n=1 Tax=Pseudovirgaria hyperparasitica TaxID=470096 RepID=A0A6A6VU69_9PEZI|nr:uncharacterized protein EJ05DRAFT_211776 [Pseudovirgaria hyperparasitica]KAF2753336.1 hypothetical protein EJ05DRAFT_211776 [Pseudovirgaria hyperparasitica]
MPVLVLVPSLARFRNAAGSFSDADLWILRRYDMTCLVELLLDSSVRLLIHRDKKCTLRSRMTLTFPRISPSFAQPSVVMMLIPTPGSMAPHLKRASCGCFANHEVVMDFSYDDRVEHILIPEYV